MNKKNINTILIIAVSCIWGVLLYKFIAPYFTKTETDFRADITIRPPVSKIIKKDTISLKFPQRDPFLGKTVAKKRTTVTTSKVKRKSNNTAKPVLWPKIVYLGFVKSRNSKGRLGLLRIDGKLHRVNSNTVIGGLKIKKITNDALIIQNGKEERIFNRN